VSAKSQLGSFTLDYAVACASDNGGEDGLDVIPADGSAARRIGHGEFGRTLELAVAPDESMAAVACADGRLLTVALDGEPVITEIAGGTNAEVAGLAFSPDSALLAWSTTDSTWVPGSVPPTGLTTCLGFNDLGPTAWRSRANCCTADPQVIRRMLNPEFAVTANDG
jgi:hypothetical protein